jgi:hypothetical protein
MKKREKKIELLNSEGPILLASETTSGGYLLEFTQEDFSVILGKKHLHNFIGGILPIIPPSGKKYVYTEFSEDMKPKYGDIVEFMRGEHIEPIVYLACPYTHSDKKVEEERFQQISKIAADLNKKGIIAFSPITYGHTLLGYAEIPSNWAFWQTFCLSFLEHSKELRVYKMEGWKESMGVQEEIEFAKRKGIKIKHFEFENDTRV